MRYGGTITIEEYERLTRMVEPCELTAERRRCGEAMRLWIRLRDEVDEAVIDRNRDRYRRLLLTTRLARARLDRRWARLVPPPAGRLGDLRIASWPKTGRWVNQKGVAECTEN